jgi:hypothetical protein
LANFTTVVCRDACFLPRELPEQQRSLDIMIRTNIGFIDPERVRP